MDQYQGETFAEAVKYGGPQHEEVHHVVEESYQPLSSVQYASGETVVRDANASFENGYQQNRDFQQRPSEQGASRRSVHGVDFGRVVESTKEAVHNIVEDGLNQQPVFGANQSFGQDYQGASGGIPTEMNQRHSHTYSEAIPSFQPTGQFLPQGGISVKYSAQHDGNADGGLDSPMAEFDVEKRRISHLGHSSSRTRRSRPVSQHVRDLVFWRNVKDSGVIFTFGLVLLLSLSYFSIISIFAYVSMTSLILITSFVLMKQITMAFQQQTSEHPFKFVLDNDVVFSPEYVHQQVDNLLKPLNQVALRVRNLYLADSIGNTLKVIFVMYILTYVGSWFNLLTLLTIIWVAAFTVPKFYVTYKEQIDSVNHVVLEGVRDLKAQASQLFHQQLTKIKGRRSDINVAAAPTGQIRSKEKVEVEVKSSGGGKIKHEKKTTEKIQ